MSDREPVGPSTASRIGQAIAIVISLAAGVVVLFCAWVLFVSFLPDNDPHGYGLIFGSILLLASSVVLGAALPSVARRDQPVARTWAFRAGVTVLILGLVIPALVLFTG